jgi:hypothetical protein
MALELSENVVISSRLVVTVWSRKPDFLQEGIIAANPRTKSNGKIVQALARFFSKKKLEKVEMMAAVPVVSPADGLKNLLK